MMGAAADDNSDLSKEVIMISRVDLVTWVQIYMETISIPY